MKHSDKITEIAKALRAAQSDIDHVQKTSCNPHFGNTYTDLNSFLKAVRGPLHEQGVTMVQAPGTRDGWVTVETLLIHDSGEWMSCEAAAPMQKSDPQGVGSAITYLRRYSLASLLAIPQEDDDGNAASHGRSVGSRQRVQEPEDPSEFPCPDCGGPMWDNREDPKAGRNGGKRPDWKCKDKACDNAIWGHHPGELPGVVEKMRDDARDLGAIDEDAQVRIEEALENGDPDRLRLAKDWLKTQIDKAKMDAGASVAGSGAG